MKTFKIASLFLCLLLISCPQPTIRQTRESPDYGPDPNVEYKKPDLKKRFWIVPLREYKPMPEDIQGVDLTKIIEKKLIETFNSDDSPYIIPGAEDSLENMGLLPQLSPVEVSRMARAAAVTGFLRANITQLDFRVQNREAGLLESAVYELILGIDYELYDSVTGRQLAKGFETHSLKEPRNVLVGRQLTGATAERRFISMADALSKKIYKRLAPFSEKLGWSGRILRMDGTRVYLNAGKKSGLKIDDVLKVMDQPRDVVDPETGKYVGQAPGRIKGTLKVIEYFGVDGAVAVIQSGAGILVNDIVELY